MTESQEGVTESELAGVGSSVDFPNVFVTDISGGERGAAHSLQYLESEGLSVWHFWHLITTAHR